MNLNIHIKQDVNIAKIKTYVHSIVDKSSCTVTWIASLLNNNLPTALRVPIAK